MKLLMKFIFRLWVTELCTDRVLNFNNYFVSWTHGQLQKKKLCWDILHLFQKDIYSRKKNLFQNTFFVFLMHFY